MTFQTFKIHGDNIVECERIYNFITRRLDIIESVNSLSHKQQSR